MELNEFYDNILTSCDEYYKVLAEQKGTEQKLSDLSSYLEQKTEQIKKYGLEQDVCKLLNKKLIDQETYEELISKKEAEERLRMEEEERLRTEEEERLRTEEEERLRKEEEERRRRQKEESDLQRREEEERRRHEEEERRKRELRKKIIKYTLIVLAAIFVISLVYWVITEYVIPFIEENWGWILFGFTVVGYIVYRIKKDD